MHFIHEHIGIFTFLFLVSGWLLHMYALFAFISNKKRMRVSFDWYWVNRRPQFKKSILLALVLGTITYIFFYPPAYDLSIESDRQKLALFITFIVIAGGGSSFIMDIARKKSKASGKQDLEIEEDGKSMILSDEERERIIREHDDKD